MKGGACDVKPWLEPPTYARVSVTALKPGGSATSLAAEGSTREIQ